MVIGKGRVLAVFCLALPGLAAADGNTLFLVQDSTGGTGARNTLSIDQSGGTNTQIAGSVDGLAPARQTGSGNAADINVAGTDVTVLFSQGGATDTAFNNTATINADGQSLFASLEQLGSDNTGVINLDGTNSSGTILQDGVGNTGALTVGGTNASGTLVQRGNDNDLGLVVSGADTNVSFTLVGNGLGPGPLAATEGGSVAVFSNAGTVNITTTVLGGP